MKLLLSLFIKIYSIEEIYNFYKKKEGFHEEDYKYKK